MGGYFTTASADRRATASPGSMPRPAWLIRSTRTRTVTVYSIAVQADGKILVGGDFTNIGGQTRNRIARLDATTGLADSFNPNANSTVYSIAVQADGKILAGGSFHAASADRRATASPGSMPRPAWLIRSTRTRTVMSIQSRCRRTARFWWAAFSRSIGGQTRNHIARLDATTGLADSFNPNANGRCLFNRGAGGRQDFGGRHFHAASADRRATASPGSMPPPVWLIRSTRTRTILSIQSRCRRTARF